MQRHLLTTPERINRLIGAARGAPEVSDLLIRYAMGEVSYFEARRRLLLRSPRLAVRLFVATQRILWRRRASVRTDMGPALGR